MNLDNIFYRVKIFNPNFKLVEDFDAGSFSDSMALVYYYFQKLGYDFIRVEISHAVNGKSNFRLYKTTTRIS